VAVPSRLLTGPIRITGPLRLAHLSTLVSADVIARWSRANGRELEWLAGILAGDLGGQRDMERELAREGLDRAALGREAFVGRVRIFEADTRSRIQTLLDDLGASVDLEAGRVDDPAVVRAARIAFVRLYEGGRLTRTEEVTDVCPRCETIVDPVDSDPTEAPATRWVLRLRSIEDPEAPPVEVGVVAPELLFGAVAIAVPGGHPAAGSSVDLPITDTVVPVIEAVVDEPMLMVPAHDEQAWGWARQLGVNAVEVLDADGVVRAAGPLDGLPRFAAREQAAALLAVDPRVGAPDQVTEITRRCRRCGTLVVPRLGRHWFLAMADCEVAAADIVRDGQITFHPPPVGDELIASAGASGPWCLSRQVWAGQPVPVSTCLDCGRRAVAVETDQSCGTCMGTLQPDDDVLDARFLAAMWPLAAAGWPDHEREVAGTAAATMALAAPSSVVRWVLPSIAVALAVAGTAPFAHLAVLDVDIPGDDRDAAIEADLADLLAGEGRAVARVALALAGTSELAVARDLVAGLVDPPPGDTDVAALAAAVAADYERGSPADAAFLLVAALSTGIPSDAAAHQCLRWLAGPLVGE
jgi:valyl-tRNA synthetase